MADRANLRASDADREHVAERLRHAATEGRLSADELEERLHHAFSGRTYGQLDPLLADLPGPRTPATRPLLPAASPKTSGMAIASVALAFFWMGGIGSLAAVIFGLLARKEIQRSQGWVTGRALAIAGIALGILGLLGAAALVLLSAATGLVGHPIEYR